MTLSRDHFLTKLPYAPSPPLNIIIDQIKYESFHIAWSTPNSKGGVPLANYTVNRQMEVEGCFLEPRSMETQGHSLMVNTVEGGSGKTYRVYVTASNIGAQISAPSQFVDVRLPVPSTTICIKPFNFDSNCRFS